MSNISGVVARVFVDDLDAAIPLYSSSPRPARSTASVSATSSWPRSDRSCCSAAIRLSTATGWQPSWCGTCRRWSPPSRPRAATSSEVPPPLPTVTGSSPAIPTGQSSSTSRPEMPNYPADGASGPLPSRDLPDTCQVPWQSTGWTNNRNVTQLVEFMVLRGSNWTSRGPASGHPVGVHDAGRAAGYREQPRLRPPGLPPLR